MAFDALVPLQIGHVVHPAAACEALGARLRLEQSRARQAVLIAVVALFARLAAGGAVSRVGSGPTRSGLDEASAGAEVAA